MRIHVHTCLHTGSPSSRAVLTPPLPRQQPLGRRRALNTPTTCRFWLRTGHNFPRSKVACHEIDSSILSTVESTYLTQPRPYVSKASRGALLFFLFSSSLFSFLLPSPSVLKPDDV